MRVRVKSTWRTRVLLLLAVIAAGIIAWFQVEHRAREREAERGSYQVEVEIAE